MVEGPLRIGLIGLGRHGLRYARHLAAGDVPGVVLAAFWRRDEAAGRVGALDLGVSFEPDLHRLIARPDVGALVGVIPAGAHETVALSVAAAGKALLLEKPIARTEAEATRICAAFRTAGVPLMIAQTLRFDPLVVALRERAPAFGPLRGFSFEQRLEPRGLAWEDDPALSGGGVLIQTGIHAVDALRYTTGADLAVLHAASARTLYRHNEDHATVILRATGGLASSGAALGMVAASKIGGSRHHRFALYLEKGGLEADLIARTLTSISGRDRSVHPYPETPTVVAALTAFAAVVREGAANPIPGEDALASLAVVSSAYQ